MSWSLTVSGKSSKLAEVIQQRFLDTGGCPKGTAEEEAKNALGKVAEILCGSFADDKVVTIVASGSAWNEGGKARHQACKFELTTHGDFVE